MKRLLTTYLALCLSWSIAEAQDTLFAKKDFSDRNILNHLDVSLTLGSTGIGFELASPIGNHVRLRTGFAAMPHFNHHMHFGIQNYDDQQGIIETQFDKLANMMKDFTGYEMDDQVEMIGQPTYNNFKLLVDIMPFRDKRWHFTTGFYIGPTQFAKAFNTTEEMTSLLTLGIYNRMYNYMKEETYLYEPIYGEVFLDPDIGDMMKEEMTEYGLLGIHIGDFRNEYMTDENGELILDKDGNPQKKPYIMKPDADGMVRAKMKVNKFKPYIGFGYGTAHTGKDSPFNVSFDCGIMFWGGTPSIITHDGTNLTKEVENIGGKVGSYVNALKKLKIFPVVDFKVSYRLF